MQGKVWGGERDLPGPLWLPKPAVYTVLNSAEANCEKGSIPRQMWTVVLLKMAQTSYFHLEPSTPYVDAPYLGA